VVDPDSRRAPALKDALMTGGAEVTVASSGSFALTMLERNRHDVVVSRAHIDDMHGHELCAILKADPSTRDVRFVLVASAEEVSAAEMAASGVDLVLPPGMTGSALPPLIIRLMQGAHASAAEAAPPAAPEPTRAPTSAAATNLWWPHRSRRRRVPRARPRPWPRRRPHRARLHRRRRGCRASSHSPRRRRPPPPPRAMRRGDRWSGGPMGQDDAEDRGAVAGHQVDGTERPAAARRPGPAPAPAAPRPVPARTAIPPQVADLLKMPSGTFQGSLEVMDLADLTQAIAGGGRVDG